MATKYYGIKDNWTDDDVANVIEVASEDGSVSSVKVNGVEYGGGGGLDVNHLALMIVNNTANNIYVVSDLVDSLNNLMILIEGAVFSPGEMFVDPKIISGSSATIKLPYHMIGSNYLTLNKGSYTMVASNSVNCTYADDEYYPEIDIIDGHESSSITITIS